MWGGLIYVSWLICSRAALSVGQWGLERPTNYPVDDLSEQTGGAQEDDNGFGASSATRGRLAQKAKGTRHDTFPLSCIASQYPAGQRTKVHSSQATHSAGFLIVTI